MGKCREREKELRRRRHRRWKRRKERIKQLKARSCKLDHQDETFVSRFTFYDPETFVVVVEKDERIDVGSEKERWLKEKGFYMTARFGR
jgi:hypothetical protein